MSSKQITRSSKLGYTSGQKSSLLSLALILSTVSVCQTNFEQTLPDTEQHGDSRNLSPVYLQADSMNPSLGQMQTKSQIHTASSNVGKVLRDIDDDVNQFNLTDMDFLAMINLSSGRSQRGDANTGQISLLADDQAAQNSRPAPKTRLAQASGQIPSEMISVRSGSDIRINTSDNVANAESSSIGEPYPASNLISISPAQFAPVGFLPRTQQSFIEQQQQSQYGNDLGPLTMAPMTQMDGSSVTHDQAMPLIQQSATHKYAAMRKSKQASPPEANTHKNENNNSNGNNDKDEESARNGDDDRRSSAFYADLQYQQPSLSQQHQLMPSQLHHQQAYMGNVNPQQTMYPMSPMAPMSGYVPFERSIDQSIGATATSIGSAPNSRKSQKPLMSLTNGQLMALIEELKEFNGRYASNKSSAPSTSRTPHKKEQLESRTEIEKTSATDDDDDDSSSDNGSADSDSNETTNEQDTASSKSESRKKEPRLTADKDDLAKFAKFLLTKEGANMKFQLSLDKDAPDDGDETDDKDDLMDLKRSHKDNRRKSRTRKKKANKELDDVDKRNSRAASQLDKLIEDLTERAAELEREEDLKKKNKKNRDNDSTKVDAFSEGYKRARRDGADLNEAKLKVRTESKLKKLDRAPLRSLRSEKGHVDNQPKRLIADEMKLDKQENEQDTGESMEEASERVNSARINKRLGAPLKQRLNSSSVAAKSVIRPISKKRVVKALSPGNAGRRKNAMRSDIRKLRKLKSRYRTVMPISAGIIGKDVMDSSLADLSAQYHNNGSLELANDRNGRKLSIRVPQEQVDYENATMPEVGNDASQTQFKPVMSVDPNNKTVSIHTSKIADEYPISEKVSERLNKLSNSLNQYFNDGFLTEVKPKSKLMVPEESAPGTGTNEDEAEVFKRQYAEPLNDKRDGIKDDVKEKQRNLEPKRLKNSRNSNRQSNPNDRESAASSNNAVKEPLDDPPSPVPDSTNQKSDPVDTESLDTPIGPDEDEN